MVSRIYVNKNKSSRGFKKGIKLFVMKDIILFVIIILDLNCTAKAQPNTSNLTLEDALKIGREMSLVSMENHNLSRIAYWQYMNYRADLFPNITMDGILPNLNRSLAAYQKEDGTFDFIPNNNISERLNLTISQAIPLTGGRLYMQSNIERIDQLQANNNKGGFLTIPVNITFYQPLFAFNSLKWTKRIEPLKYEASKQRYLISIENVNLNTISRYFTFLFAHVNRNIAYQNKKNAEELYRIATGKKEIGVISENELMQLKVGVLNAEANIIIEEQGYKDKMNTLKNYLGIEDSVEIIPAIPNKKIIADISYVQVIEKSTKNNPVFYDFKTRILEAERNIAEAKSKIKPNIQLQTSIGFTGSAKNFADSYGELKNREIFEIGISIPILDWGKRKGQLELAKSQQKLQQVSMEREQNDFYERIRSLYQQIKDRPALEDIFLKADSIAQDRYKIAFKKFTLGTVNILDINSAEQEKNDARRNYINQLYLSWLYYYNLRYITLYDFEKKQDIILDD
jgi:outer membrane protein TolC